MGNSLNKAKKPTEEPSRTSEAAEKGPEPAEKEKTCRDCKCEARNAPPSESQPVQAGEPAEAAGAKKIAASDRPSFPLRGGEDVVELEQKDMGDERAGEPATGVDASTEAASTEAAIDSAEERIPKEEAPREEVPREEVPREEAPEEQVPKDKAEETLAMDSVPEESTPKAAQPATSEEHHPFVEDSKAHPEEVHEPFVKVPSAAQDSMTPAATAAPEMAAPLDLMTTDKGQIEERMEKFSISDRKMKLTSALDVSDFVSTIKAHPEIRIVALDGNTIGVDAAKALAEAIDNLTHIEEFHVNDGFTGRLKEEVHVCVEAFAHVLKTKESLKKVDFSDNAFGPVGARAVSILLSEAFALRELILNNNGLGPEGGKIIAQALLDCQTKNAAASRTSALRRVEIGRNRLENGSAAAFSQALKTHGLLEEIALPQNGIRPEGICELSSGLAANPNLITVNLQDNTFTASGSEACAEALKSLSKLRSLNVGDCLMGNEGCQLVVDALVASGCPIESINLQYNEMNEDGVLHLVKNLDKLSTIQVLMLNGNCFNPLGEAAELLKEALQSANRADILDAWSDMEYYSDEDESDGALGSDDERCELPTETGDGFGAAPVGAVSEDKAEEAELADELSKLNIQHNE